MANKKETTIKINPIVDETAIIRVIGDTPLIVHKWSEKNKEDLPAGQRALSINPDITKKKEYMTPIEAFASSMYWISGKPDEITEESVLQAIENGARFGFRVESFKQAAIDAAFTKKWITNKKGVKGLFFIKPDFVDDEGYQLVEIKGSKPIMREDVVILAGQSRVPDLRWRGQFTNWYCDLTIQYDRDGIYTLQDICNMLQAGGRYNGIGEYRPEKDGQFGMFHVDTK